MAKAAAAGARRAPAPRPEGGNSAARTAAIDSTPSERAAMMSDAEERRQAGDAEQPQEGE
jgi:hypothetical protein